MSSTMSSPNPVTPDRGLTARNVYRRSVTAPLGFNTPTRQSQAAVEIGAAEGIETLYTHPSAKVVSFSTAGSRHTSRPNSSSEGPGSIGQSDAGLLPWNNSSDRTLAAGPLEIYRVPGSVSFLHSGALLHAILPRSQCWCVDGLSKFVFRVRPDTYYRLELPVDSEEDLGLVERLRDTLRKVLQYERTLCPFQRGFSVDLPEAPERRPRKPSAHIRGPAKRWKLEGVWRPEGGDVRHSPRSSDTESTDGDPGEQDLLLDLRRDQHTPVESQTDSDVGLRPGVPIRPGSLAGARSLTAPPQLTTTFSPPSKPPVTVIREETIEETDNTTRTTLAPLQLSGLPPTPDSLLDKDLSPFTAMTNPEATESENTLEPSEASPSRADSPATVQNEGPLVVEKRSEPEQTIKAERPAHVLKESGSAARLREFSRGSRDAPSNAVRQRRKKTPSSTSLASSSSDSAASRLYRTRSSESQRALANGIVQKTCAIVLGPPANLVSLMLRIAARFAKGAMDITVHSPAGSHRKVPGSWDLSEDEDDWDIDDYGFPIAKTSAVASAQSGLGKAWQIE